MTVRINKPALNLREELTKAQGVVRYEQRQFWMDGLVENGTFDADISGWTNASTGGGSISWNASGYLQLNAVSPDRGVARTTIQTEAGVVYRLIATDEGSATSWQVNLSTFAGGNNILSGTSNTSDKNILFTALGSTTHIALISNTTTGTSLIDNVQVFEVDENDNVIQSLPLGWKPLHVYEDGLLQREGDVHDYTVVKTGGAYAIKPTVQPTATTETCIIAEREL